MLSLQLLSFASSLLSQKYGKAVDIKKSTPVGGGCINACYRLETDKGPFFLKSNHAAFSRGMFEAEAKGLQLLKNANQFHVPEVISCADNEITSVLILEWIESSKSLPSFWKDFGTALAQLHKQSSHSFGLDHTNYIGSLSQFNENCSTWPEFFMSQRIEPQLKLASERISPALKNQFSLLFKKLFEVFPSEPPALLHGDLWNGNYIVDSGGKACIFDPAVYYGHREMDLGMTRLFGGFPETFYHAYQEAYPLEKGWEKRLDICNLYPLLVHVNLFGESYVPQIQAILKSL